MGGLALREDFRETERIIRKPGYRLTAAFHSGKYYFRGISFRDRLTCVLADRKQCSGGAPHTEVQAESGCGKTHEYNR